MSRFVIACGGTGGHLAPGICLAEELLARGQECLLIVSRKDIDARLLEKYPHLEFRRAPGAGLSWRPLPLLRFCWSQTQAVFFALSLVRQWRPDVYVSFGGFLSLGLAVVCRAKGIPVVLHEANRIPGKAVRVLGKIATRVWLPNGVRIAGLPEQVQRDAGFPVRKEIVKIPREEACRQLGLEEAGKLLLVLGGSQGAASLNRWAEENAPVIVEASAQILCVAGPTQRQPETHRISVAGKVREVRFIPFCDRMAAALSAADLVVSRAGAGSIAEMAACGVPAVLVPLPTSADGHQDENARFVAEHGGGVVVEQGNLEKLTVTVTELLRDDVRRGKLRGGAVALRRFNDWSAMVTDLLALGEAGRKEGRQ